MAYASLETEWYSSENVIFKFYFTFVMVVELDCKGQVVLHRTLFLDLIKIKRKNFLKDHFDDVLMRSINGMTMKAWQIF